MIIKTNKFNEKIKALRKKKQISCSELARQLGVDRRMVSKWEKENNLPNLNNLLNLSKFFKVSINKLIDNEITLTIEYENYTKYEKRDI